MKPSITFSELFNIMQEHGNRSRAAGINQAKHDENIAETKRQLDAYEISMLIDWKL